VVEVAVQERFSHGFEVGTVISAHYFIASLHAHFIAASLGRLISVLLDLTLYSSIYFQYAAEEAAAAGELLQGEGGQGR
jgi:hypothetical protein